MIGLESDKNVIWPTKTLATVVCVKVLFLHLSREPRYFFRVARTYNPEQGKKSKAVNWYTPFTDNWNRLKKSGVAKTKAKKTPPVLLAASTPTSGPTSRPTFPWLCENIYWGRSMEWNTCMNKSEHLDKFRAKGNLKNLEQKWVPVWSRPPPARAHVLTHESCLPLSELGRTPTEIIRFSRSRTN